MTDIKIDVLASEIDGDKTLTVISKNENDEIVGICRLFIGTYVGTIVDMFVSENFRRQGVGRKMANFCIKHSAFLKMRCVTVYINSENVEAYEFWSYCGLKICVEEEKKVFMTMALE